MVYSKTHRILTTAACCLALAAPGAAMAGPNLVLNGSFSQGSPFTANSQFGSAGYANLPNWTVSAVTYGSGNSSPFDLWFIASTATTVSAQTQYGNSGQYLRAFAGQDGSYADMVALDGAPNVGGALSQTISGLTKGTDYVLSFDWAAAQLATGSGNYTASLVFNFGSSALTSAAGAQTAGSFSGGTGSYSAWTTKTFIFEATSTSEVLSFLSIGTLGTPPIILLDGISMYAAPEPSTLAVLGSGIVVAAVWRRRRGARKQAVLF